MKGKIIKGISGFYYVHTAESGIYECRAKGIFRNRKIKPLVGDNVEIEILHEADKEGNIIAIESRKNELIRPSVSNINQALLIFSVTNPAPNYNLLDRFLVMMRYQSVPVILCFNKSDLMGEADKENIFSVYRACGCPVLFTSVEQKYGMDELRLLLKGKTSAASGPSGVGKSSIVNFLQQNVKMETGDVSRKIGRGKNTTRHSQMIFIEKDTYIMDTPGFGSLNIPGLCSADLWRYYEEFLPYEPECRFKGCSHIHEPGCGIKQALFAGNIHPKRYENYVSIYEELKENEKNIWRKP